MGRGGYDNSTRGSNGRNQQLARDSGAALKRHYIGTGYYAVGCSSVMQDIFEQRTADLNAALIIFKKA
jgi:hypothetical protein